MKLNISTNAPTENEVLEYPENPEEFALQVRKKLAALLLNRLHAQPVRDLGVGVSFGSWIALTREQAHLTELDLAVGLNLPEASIPQICSDDFRPWTATPSQMADLMVLFRLHLDAVTAFVNSHQARGSNTEITSGSTASQVGTWLRELREELLARTSEDLIC